MRFVLTFMFLTGVTFAQRNYWQQQVKYTMDINMDVTSNRFTGKQKLIYTNHSPDTLKKVYYHLYWNAFQPGSSMDIRSQQLGKNVFNGRQDWDARVKDRIAKLNPSEIGYQKINSLKMGGVTQQLTLHETILEVVLSKPILPNATVTFDMEFEAQVPIQIRRSGRENPQTGVKYSMSQWYPKMCEYDYLGWHATPYIAREFYGVWGDFDVRIAIDKNFKLGATGVLMNADEIGWGYDKPGTNLAITSGLKRTWKFSAKNVHDFVWAADTAFNHLSEKIGSTALHVIYKNKPDNKANDSAWNVVLTAAKKVLPFIEQKFGKYPYPQYSFIQGGDGGMEYPMATLLAGPSLGTVFHEWMHSWYQMMLGTNESLYAWMDEGFTSFAEDLISRFYYGVPSIQQYKNNLLAQPDNIKIKELLAMLPDDHSGAYESYFFLSKSGLEEPLTTHADHFNTNLAYSIASYSKGEVFMEQLGYIISASVRDKVLIDYYNKWRFKHPDVNDFIKVAQQQSGLQLDWYKSYWVNSTKTIDYAIDSLWEEDGVSKIRISRIGKMPMPIDLKLTFKDASVEMHNIPLNLMFGSKPKEDQSTWIYHDEWRWTHPTYVVTFKRKLTDLVTAEIDPSKRMADVDRKNNRLELKW